MACEETLPPKGIPAPPLFDGENEGDWNRVVLTASLFSSTRQVKYDERCMVRFGFLDTFPGPVGNSSRSRFGWRMNTNISGIRDIPQRA